MGRCIKFLMFVLNLFIWLGGAVLLGVSVWVFAQDTPFQHVTGNIYVNCIFIGLSSFMFILGFIGTCGILLGNICLLKMYFSFVLVFLIIQVGLGVFLYLERGKIESHVKKNWNETTDETRILIQEKLKCCSVNPVITSHSSSKHESCFTSSNKTLTKHEDCYIKLANFFEENWIILGTSAIVLALFEIFVLFGSCRLIFEVKRSRQLPKRTQVVPLQAFESPAPAPRQAGYPSPPQPDSLPPQPDYVPLRPDYVPLQLNSVPPEPEPEPSKKLNSVIRQDSINRKNWAKNAPRQQLQPKVPKRNSVKK